jgi:hypothetical protein
MNIELPDTITVPLGRNGKYGSRDVRLRTCPQSRMYAFEYGVRQASTTQWPIRPMMTATRSSPELIVAKADKRIDALMNGTIRQRAGGSAEPLDPVEAEAWRIVKADLVVMAKPFAEHVKGLKGDAALLARINVSRVNRRMAEFESLEDAITAYLGGPRGQAIMKRAQRNVAERAKAVDMAEAGI